MNIPITRYWGLLKKYLRNHYKLFFIMSSLLLFSIFMQIFNPQIMKKFIDAVHQGKSSSELYSLAFLFMGIAVFQKLISAASTYTSEKVAWKTSNEIRCDLIKHVLNLDMSFHNSKTPGELLERIDGDIQQIVNFFSSFIIMTMGNVLLLIGILTYFFIKNPLLGSILFVYTILILLVLYKNRSLAKPHFKENRESNAKIFGYLGERLNGIEDIKANGGAEYIINGLDKLHYNLNQSSMKSREKSMMISIISRIAFLISNLLALSLGYYLFSNGKATIGFVYLIVHYVNMLSRPIRLIVSQTQSIQSIGANFERIFELFDMKKRILDGDKQLIVRNGLSISFDNVDFSYNDKDFVLNNLNFDLDSGKVLGILGRTGSGKTTISRLLFRLYDISKGKILINDENIQNLFLKSLRKNIAIVTQDVQLFKASIRDNITLFDSSISDDQIIKAIDALQLSNWFNSLENGLDTELDSSNKGLSAGEAQLLAFTRIFLSNPSLIILDEASSRLDPATENLIEKAISKLIQNRTVIIIAHRLSTIEKADQILILEDGQISEFGERDMLTSDPKSRLNSLIKTGMEEVLA